MNILETRKSKNCRSRCTHNPQLKINFTKHSEFSGCFFCASATLSNLGCFVVAFAISLVVLYSCPVVIGSGLVAFGSCLFVVDSCLFVVGSCLFVAGSCLVAVGSCPFVVGSCLFVVGGCLFVVEIRFVVNGVCYYLIFYRPLLRSFARVMINFY